MRTMICSCLLVLGAAVGAIIANGGRHNAFAASAECSGCNCGAGMEKLCYVVDTYECRSWTIQYGDLICTAFDRRREYHFIDERAAASGGLASGSDVDAAI